MNCYVCATTTTATAAVAICPSCHAGLSVFATSAKRPPHPAPEAPASSLAATTTPGRQLSGSPLSRPRRPREQRRRFRRRKHRAASVSRERPAVHGRPVRRLRANEAVECRTDQTLIRWSVEKQPALDPVPWPQRDNRGTDERAAA